MPPLTVLANLAPFLEQRLSKFSGNLLHNSLNRLAGTNFSCALTGTSFVRGLRLPDLKYYKSDTDTMPSAEMKSLVLKYSKINPEAFAPTKGSLKAAGYDLKSSVDIIVPARGKALVDTGLKIELPEGCYGRIAPRSGLAVKNFIDVGAGVVDEDYRGPLKVVLFNHSDGEFEVKKGDRIAQLICERIYYPDLQEVEELTDTVRGEGGFGSTGTN